MAIVSLLSRKKYKTIVSQKPDLTLLLLWIFTFVLFISRTVELGSLMTTKLIWEMTYIILWAPLYMALERMDDYEIKNTKKFIVIASGVTASIALLIVITGSYNLYDLFANRSEDLMRKSFLGGRIVVYGLWTFMPLGLWFCLSELLCKNNTRKEHLLYLAIAIAIFFVIVINLTRSLFLGFLTGLFFLVISAKFNFPKYLSNKINKFTIAIFLIGLVFILSSGTIYTSWLERYEEAQSGGSIQGRLIRISYVLDRLIKDMPIFGNKDYWSSEAQTSLIVGDPHTFINVWTSYGLIASILFVSMITIVFIRLIKIYLYRKQFRKDSIINWAFLFGFYIQFHWMMLFGDYLIDLTVFLLILFLVELKRVENSIDLHKI